jgi:hypothetical protein
LPSKRQVPAIAEGTSEADWGGKFVDCTADCGGVEAG